jgi:hypothetical protein
MHVLFQVVFEEAPEARKFSKDLWASSFVLPNVRFKWPGRATRLDRLKF